ncbi:unnamed protein product [Nesidiocoris tenuis]|uniref:Centrosome-associated FAM110 C-terminal domain-containing protein n=1 Tax=Nesidiocoris tenuis TaxID=355587 RepID=A0A6H5H2L8_9HEMI|nr:unnamed protein product [Nesidiocoris tenuis]
MMGLSIVKMDAPAAKPVEARREPTSAKVRKKVTPTHTRLTTWTEAKHKPLSRCKSDVTVNEDRRMSVSRLPHQPSLPSELNEFFQNLGLTSDQYNELTNEESKSSSPVFFSSHSSISDDSSSTTAARRHMPDDRGDSPTPTSPVSVVQTNARVVKWLCKTSQYL